MIVIVRAMVIPFGVPVAQEGLKPDHAGEARGEYGELDAVLVPQGELGRDDLYQSDKEERACCDRGRRGRDDLQRCSPEHPCQPYPDRDARRRDERKRQDRPRALP